MEGERGGGGREVPDRVSRAGEASGQEPRGGSQLEGAGEGTSAAA